MKQTCLKHYGVEFSSQSEELKKKTKETCLKKYGVDSPMKNEQVKSKLLKGNVEKYGFKCPLSNKEIMSKAEETCLEKYGTKNYNQSESGKERKKNTLLKLYGVENISQIEDVKLKKKNNYIEKCKKEINLLKDKYNKVYSIKELSSILNRDSTTIIGDCRKLNIDLKKGLTENFYVKDLVRYPRYKFMRNKIKKMYNDKLLNYWNDDESEEIIMFNNGYGRVYDCGTIKLKYIKR